MSSDLFVFDDSFFNDPFSPFSDTSIDILQAIPDNQHTVLHNNTLDETNSFDRIAPNFLSSSPPSHQLENLSLYQATHLQNDSNSANPYGDYSTLEVKTEECQLAFHLPNSYQSFGPHSYGGTENAMKMMQRNNSFNGKHEFLFQSCFDGLMESPNFQPQIMSPPQNSFSPGQMRRVCSTGDLQIVKANQTNHRMSSSPLAAESSFMEEANYKVGRYSAEERKERIHKYRAKRTQRNFNKTIKYACRKTLADNRPRVRGRFARNDEMVELPKVAAFNQYEEEDDHWVDGFNLEDNEVTEGRGPFYSGFVGGGPFFSSLDVTHF
ncbi:zinc finger protein CO3 [Cornus florida]|uniref:zinc finger protein CO3 n=1 Tax=Cornus florida TaxID=4283 RepID=UPI0028A01F8C|nr:zinc finger protein CO3 [Cornus florida]